MRKQERIDVEQQLPLEPAELRHRAIVLKQPILEGERVTVRNLHRRSGGRPHVRQKQPRMDVLGQALKIRVIPGGVRLAIHARSLLLSVPADAKPVPVRRFDVLPRMPALIDQRMIRTRQQGTQPQRRPGISKPTAHQRGSPKSNRSPTPRTQLWPAAPAMQSSFAAPNQNRPPRRPKGCKGVQLAPRIATTTLRPIAIRATHGDCPNFSVPWEKNGTVPLAPPTAPRRGLFRLFRALKEKQGTAPSPRVSCLWLLTEAIWFPQRPPGDQWTSSVESKSSLPSSSSVSPTPKRTLPRG